MELLLANLPLRGVKAAIYDQVVVPAAWQALAAEGWLFPPWESRSTDPASPVVS